jgi:hypothetical protein
MSSGSVWNETMDIEEPHLEQTGGRTSRMRARSRAHMRDQAEGGLSSRRILLLALTGVSGL